MHLLGFLSGRDVREHLPGVVRQEALHAQQDRLLLLRLRIAAKGVDASASPCKKP